MTRLFIAMLILGLAGCTSTSSLFTSNEPPPPPPAPEQSAAPPASQGAPQTGPRGPMTRKALARHAKVSERYLAQLEAGLGNGSIVLLRRISRAIGLPVTQLVHEGSEPALDLVLLTQFLERLSPPTLGEARDLLLRHFSEPSDNARRHRIALIGLRGGGKSTLGQLAAERLSVPFIELDREIEKRSGATLSEIFDMGFRVGRTLDVP